jgi:hypothetical protein
MMLNRLKRAWKKITKKEDVYVYLTGSRRVIKDARPEQSGYYGSDDFRYQATEIVKPFLRKGETIFYEIVGYAGDSFIMEPGNNTVVGDPDFIKKFGETTEWTYGCIPGQFKIFVYDWKICNEDGTVQYSYPFDYIMERCLETGGILNTVPVLHSFSIKHEDVANYLSSTSKTVAELKDLVELETQDKFSTIGNHMREGVCIRIERKGEVLNVLKNKATSFGIIEGYLSADTVNIEELESY